MQHHRQVDVVAGIGAELGHADQRARGVAGECVEAEAPAGAETQPGTEVHPSALNPHTQRAERQRQIERLVRPERDLALQGRVLDVEVVALVQTEDEAKLHVAMQHQWLGLTYVRRHMQAEEGGTVQTEREVLLVVRQRHDRAEFARVGGQRLVQDGLAVGAHDGQQIVGGDRRLSRVPERRTDAVDDLLGDLGCDLACANAAPDARHGLIDKRNRRRAGNDGRQAGTEMRGPVGKGFESGRQAVLIAGNRGIQCVDGRAAERQRRRRHVLAHARLQTRTHQRCRVA